MKKLQVASTPEFSKNLILQSPSRNLRTSGTLDLSSEAIAVPILTRKDLEPYLGQCSDSRKINLDGQRLSPEAFDLILSIIKSVPGLKRLYVSKECLTQEQQKMLMELTGANNQKTLRVSNSEGDLVGPIHTNWSVYAAEKRDDYLRGGMRESTSVALKFIQEDSGGLPDFVLDFGAGTGNDTIPLAQMGCPVIWALDGEKKALKNLMESVRELEVREGALKSEIVCINTPFIELEILNQVDLLVASFAWPYRCPDDFPACWKKCIDVVKLGGYISGQFFGPKTGCIPDPGMTYHTEQELRILLQENFQIMWFHKDPEGKKMKIFGGEEPGWGDLFHVVAKRMQ